MKKARLLLTSVGGLVAPGMIKSLKSCRDYDLYITGVDSQPDAVGFKFVDSSHVVVRGDDPSYAKEILDIAKREKIDIVIPLSDEETLALAKDKDLFEREGIKVATSSYEVVKIASNKASMLEFLKDKGVPVPDFYMSKSIEELKANAKRLGYPDKRIVFKPTTSRGARGFWILDAKLNKRDWLLKSRARQEITLEWLIEALDKDKDFPDIVLMEYLEGDDFNVDILAKSGKALYCVPNKRIVPDAGPVQVGHIKEERAVQDLAARVVDAFGFNYCVNIEIAYRGRDNKEPFIYEINPRISAPIVANKAAGIDLLLKTIKLALGEEIDETLRFKDTKMFRYWDEVFV